MTNNAEMITPLIITFNEAPNIERTLKPLMWAKRIVVIDSFSTDETLSILKQFSQVVVFQNKFMSFADQCNFGLQKIDTEWVMSLDADYVLDETIVNNVLNLSLNPNAVAAYSARFKYAIFGKPVRGSLYPPRKVLYTKKKAHYVNDGHGHTVVIDGTVKTLDGFIHHDDRKSFTHWVASQDRYLKKEADKLMQTPFKQLKMADKLRYLIVPAPFFVLFYCLILRGGIFDGKHGWLYAMQRFLAEIMLSIRLTEARILDVKYAEPQFVDNQKTELTI
jgi:glycosyltransferase involved in cell wall biosynthesis